MIQFKQLLNSIGHRQNMLMKNVKYVGIGVFYNIASGYPDGTFKPNNNLKLEEFIKMVVVAVEDKPVEKVQGKNGIKSTLILLKRKLYKRRFN